MYHKYKKYSIEICYLLSDGKLRSKTEGLKSGRQLYLLIYDSQK